jgi:MFS family permease
LTYWFPARRRAAMVAWFATSIPISVILGSPVSGWILGSMGGRAGWTNWQWLFVLEGIPSILVGLAALLLIADKPAEARWLTAREKKLVLDDLQAEHIEAGAREHGFLRALRLPRVWLLGAIHFCAISSNVTIGFWVPSIIKDSMGVKDTLTIGLLTAVPYGVALIGMIVVGRHSDRTQERRYHAALPCLACAAGLVGVGVFAGAPLVAFTAMCIAVAGSLSYNGAFWQIPPMLLAGSAAAGGIALINSLGNLSGWAGPSLVGWLEDLTGKTATGLYVVAVFEVIGAALILLFMPRRRDV